MPLLINVGLSRKASENFQSSGVSINVTAELDQTLLARPDELQQQIDSLYSQAQAALERQAAASPPAPPDDVHLRRKSNRNGHGRTSNGNGRPMSGSQHNAIVLIAQRLQIDPDLEARNRIGVTLEQLSMRQASQLIDYLNGLQQAPGRYQ